MSAKNYIIDSQDLERIQEGSSQAITLRDAMTARSAHDTHPDLYESAEQWADKVGGLPSHDAFLQLFKKNVEPKDPMPRPAQPLHKLFEAGKQSPHWDNLRSTSKGNVTRAALGAGLFLDDVLTSLPQDVKDACESHAQAEQAVDKQQANVDGLQKFLEMLQKYQDKQETPDPDIEQELKNESARLQQEQKVLEGKVEFAQDQAQAANETIDDNQAQVAHAVGQAAQGAADNADKMMSFARHYSTATGADPYSIDSAMLKAAMEMYKRFPDIQKLLDALGFLKQAAIDEARRSPIGKLFHTGYKPGPLNPRNLARSEFVALNSPNNVTRTQALIRLADGKLKHKTYSGKENVGKGPIILVVDQSGSMSGELHYLAVCIEWAILELAREQGRDVFILPFGASGEYDIFDYERLEYLNPQGSRRHKHIANPGQPAALLEHLNGFYNGFGTGPYEPMIESLGLIKDRSLKADIMYLGDGDVPPASQQILDKLAERDLIKIVCLQLVPHGYASQEPETWADSVVNIEDLTDFEALGKAFEGMG